MVRWDDSDVKTSDSTVCHVKAAKDRVVLTFGANRTSPERPREVGVELTNRVTLGSDAARQLSVVLASILAEHDARLA